MLVIAAKLIGAGVATVGVAGGGIGIVFGAYLNALARNPSLKGDLFATMLLGFALNSLKKNLDLHIQKNFNQK